MTRVVRPQPAVVRRSYADVAHGQLHLRSAHTAEHAGASALVCLHLSPMSGRIYERLLACMATDRIVVAPDTPGFGQSDAPPALPEISTYAATISAALDKLTAITGPVDVLGYHTGSMIAVEMARLRPAQVRRLVLISAPIFTDAERDAFRVQYSYKSPNVDGSHVLAQWIDFCKYNLRHDQSLEEVADSFPDMLLGRGNSWWGHRAAFNYDLARRLASTTHPVIVLNPADDMQHYTTRAASHLRNGRLVDLPAWGHGFLNTHTEAAVQLLRSFLDASNSAVFSQLAVPSSALR